MDYSYKIMQSYIYEVALPKALCSLPKNQAAMERLVPLTEKEKFINFMERSEQTMINSKVALVKDNTGELILALKNEMIKFFPNINLTILFPGAFQQRSYFLDMKKTDKEYSKPGTKIRI